MNHPTRQTAAGRAYLDLQNRARRERRQPQELLLASDQAHVLGTSSI